ncbi:MAG: glutamyl-tRNA reductase [Methanobacterium sp.]|nr:glutamyl-tRNA reductase [Methanobacterium sp.]
MILNIRVDHHTADIAQIERATYQLENIFKNIEDNSDVQEYLYMKTCNRSELYLVMNQPPENYLDQSNNFKIESDEKALRHLLRLSSGLESMIIGEDQILGQIKDSRKKGIKEGSIGPVLRTVFTKAVHVGQLVRNNTRINQGSISIGSAAVELAESVHGDLKCKKVLVIGAGKMGTLVARALVEKKLKAIVVANRTYQSALRLAGELGGYAIHFEKLNEAMADADVIISATGAPHPILTCQQVKEAVLPDNLNRLVMVDIANPRDIDENVKNLGVKLFNIDDLRVIANNSVKMRESEISKVEFIVEEELKLLKKNLKHLEVEPLISNIRIYAEEIRRNETIKAFKMLGDMNGKEKIVDDLTQVLVDRIFYEVIKNIRNAAEKGDKKTIEAAETIFSGEIN